ncbi:MAG TPA: T9SS type A sorting domain-containing protein, partial [Flavobacteriales bacterium]|nr:T9SS type A sorting domain-containing protein [Flavobacteriales bacterium]
NCNCAGTIQDTDGDGVCDANDPCPLIANAVPGGSCNDGNACTINDVYDANCNCAGTIQDTDADGLCDANDPCPLLANLAPGDACDDGNANTINDLVNANCVCAGTLLDDDCEGVPGGPAQPGTACNDNNACTINDVYDANCNCAGTFQDSDSDGVCDANDPCPLLANLAPGDACDDGNANTINDLVNANCVCAGTLLDDDCEGVPGGPAQPGTACNDNNACTINDVYDANCNCAGTIQDTDGDGVCDTNDPCPLLANLAPGDACDDGNANTINDLVNANCVCAGTLLNDDCEGVPGGPAQPGTACNDNNACTINDVYDANCNCAGTFQDTDSDGICDANDPCPVLAYLQPGDACDDGSVSTENDIVNANCVCEGIPVSGCDHPVNLVIETDSNGNETTWEIVLQGTELAVCNGGPYTNVNNAFIGEQCCLTNACYELRVYDSAGDGMSTGGYVLSRLTGGRIIDNRDNGSGFASESAIANGGGFCLPLGSDNFSVTSCDKEWWATGDILDCVVNPAVSAIWNSFPAGSLERGNTGYQVWWFDPNGGYSFRRFQSHNTTNSLPASAVRASRFVTNGWLGNQLQEGVLYNVRVRSRVLGTYAEFGPACRFRIDSQLAQCPPTQLVNIPGHPEYSCGVTRQAPTTQKISSFARAGATHYRFQFSVPSEGILFTRTSPTHWIRLDWTGPNMLLNGTTYDVRVRITKDNGLTWCPYGEVCQVTIDNGTGSQLIGMAPSSSTDDIEAARMSVWPNPNRGESLNINIAGFNEANAVFTIDLFDLLGNRVMTTTRAAQDGVVNGSLELPESLGTGMYVVHVTGAGSVWTERIVMQR